jgi:hypothetical protein
MEIILSKQCEALHGSFGMGFGYFIVGRWSRKEVRYRFYSQRSKWGVPKDGHLRFIFACADLARLKTHIYDIRVSAKELRLAFDEAHILYGDRLVKANAKQIYNAGEVLDFKNYCK